MSRQPTSLLPLACMAAAVFCFCTSPMIGQAVPEQPVTWDAAFQARGGSVPLHFVADYVDSRGASHRLEEWRLGEQHLRRKTDERIDLHADATGKPLPSQPAEYTWQILDLQKHIAHRVSTAGMLHLGMLYSYYSMAHVLARPAGSFTVQHSAQPAEGTSSTLPNNPALVRLRAGGVWWQIEAPGQPAMRVCWLPQYGVPAELWTHSPAGWQRTFALSTVDTRDFPGTVFRADTAGFQVRNVDEIESSD